MPDIIINGQWVGKLKTKFSYSVEANTEQVPQEIVDALVEKVKAALAVVDKPPFDASLTVNVGGTEVINVAAPLSQAQVGAQEDLLIEGMKEFKGEFGS
jgi:hypothetical protein